MVSRRDEDGNWIQLAHGIEKSRRGLKAHCFVVPHVPRAKHRLNFFRTRDLHDPPQRRDKVAPDARAFAFREAQFGAGEATLQMQIAELQEPQCRHRA